MFGRKATTEEVTPPVAAPQSSVPAPDDPRVVRALEEYSTALKAGQRPNRHEFQARYPDVAEALAEWRASMAAVAACRT